ncbi:hypothetical protein LX36DRAFT_64783 [Colletotrichum falcatum]|nr:hypothetical protein LX36DRAFT_64783 [Colletotrichum falcatum]
MRHFHIPRSCRHIKRASQRPARLVSRGVPSFMYLLPLQVGMGRPLLIVFMASTVCVSVCTTYYLCVCTCLSLLTWQCRRLSTLQQTRNHHGLSRCYL